MILKPPLKLHSFKGCLLDVVNVKIPTNLRKLYCIGKTCALQWIPAYIGIDGNETQDKLSKEADFLMITKITLSSFSMKCFSKIKLKDL